MGDKSWVKDFRNKCNNCLVKFHWKDASCKKRKEKGNNGTNDIFDEWPKFLEESNMQAISPKSLERMKKVKGLENFIRRNRTKGEVGSD